MRLIGELDELQQARIFTAYLLVKGIETHVDEEESQNEIWVKDEDRFDEALSELKEFKVNPGDEKYSSAVQAAKVIVKEEEKKRQQIQKKIVKVSGGNLPRRRQLTIGMIAVTVIVALATGFGEGIGTDRGPAPDHPVYRALQFSYVKPPMSRQVIQKANNNYDALSVRFASISRGEVWRLFTTIFIHLGIFHLVFNMIWFFQFGTLIEHRYGAVKFGLLILAAAVISNAFQWGVPTWMDGSRPGFVNGALMTGGGGMSGVVYGLFGFIWMKSVYDRKFGYRLPQSTVVILIGWLLFCMLPTEMRGQIGFGIPVGNWAHGIGLLVGMGIGYWTSFMKPMSGK